MMVIERFIERGDSATSGRQFQQRSDGLIAISEKSTPFYLVTHLNKHGVPSTVRDRMRVLCGVAFPRLHSPLPQRLHDIQSRRAVTSTGWVSRTGTSFCAAVLSGAPRLTGGSGTTGASGAGKGGADKVGSASCGFSTAGGIW